LLYVVHFFAGPADRIEALAASLYLPRAVVESCPYLWSAHLRPELNDIPLEAAAIADPILAKA